MRAGQAKNVTMFSDMEYHEYLSKMNEFKNPGYKMIPYDFRLLKRFEILKEVKPNTRLIFMTKAFFDAIKEVHEDENEMKRGC